MQSVRGKSEKKQRREKLERSDGYVDSDNSEREDKRITRLKVRGERERKTEKEIEGGEKNEMED